MRPVGACGMPQRKHWIPREDVQAHWDALRRAYEGYETPTAAFASCPTCSTPMEKASACNSLRHCGSRDVCYVCNAAAFPWEPQGLPAEHWNACPRWDSDERWQAWTGGSFRCQEGVCCFPHRACQWPEHTAGRAAMHAARILAMLAALQAEFPDLLGTAAVPAHAVAPRHCHHAVR
jgi:hypothetical protein